MFFIRKSKNTDQKTRAEQHEQNYLSSSWTITWRVWGLVFWFVWFLFMGFLYVFFLIIFCCCFLYVWLFVLRKVSWTTRSRSTCGEASWNYTFIKQVLVYLLLFLTENIAIALLYILKYNTSEHWSIIYSHKILTSMCYHFFFSEKKGT